MLPELTAEADAIAHLREWAASGGSVVKALFGDPDGSGLSLLWAWYGPHYALPRHSHSGDCLYFVHRGEIRMGNTVLGEGDGFFAPSGAPYAYAAGPDGVEVLEFRNVCSLDMRITESLPRWEQIIDVVRANRAEWAAAAPDHA